MIAALFVQSRGVYASLPGVEAWDEERDARLYRGPWPVVAHPPCERWGRYWNGGPAWRGEPRRLGEDDGCFLAALSFVRKFSGVIEHPCDSRAWLHHGLFCPPRSGGWVAADWQGGWTCAVDQGFYGHRAPKASWLYAFGVDLPRLRWGRQRAAPSRCELLSRRERSATPIPFRDLLLSIAGTASREGLAA